VEDYLYNGTFYCIGELDMVQGYGRKIITFKFPFSVTATTPGASVQVGDDPAYVWEHGTERYSKPWECAPDMVAELEGLEVIGPFDAFGNRVPIKRIAPVVAGNDIGENIAINEHMAPALRDGQMDAGYPFRDRQTCINFGKALLMSGPADTTSIKIGPSETLNIKVEFPTLAHGGDAAITTDMIIKAHVAFAKGQDQMLNALKASSVAEVSAAANSNQIRQLAVLGDIEIADVVGTQTIDRSVPATIDNWSSLNMGQNADDPQIRRIMMYSKNNQATNVNQEMELVRDGQYVQVPFMNMRWTATMKNFYRFTHCGVIPHANSYQIKFDKGNSRYPMIFQVEPADNAMVMPLPRIVAGNRFGGPTELERPYTLMNEIGSVKITDNGVSIPAWAAGVRGFEIALWGYQYTLQ